MAYDPPRKRTLLFGGFVEGGDESSAMHATVSGTSWSSVSATGPQARGDAVFSADLLRGYAVMHGGEGDTSCDGSVDRICPDTWLWLGASWARDTGTLPPGRQGATMAFDRDRGVLVMYGGKTYSLPCDELGSLFCSEVWERGDGGWRRATTPDAQALRGPGALYQSRLTETYDGQLLLFGGVDAAADRLPHTWWWNGGAKSAPAIRQSVSLDDFGDVQIEDIDVSATHTGDGERFSWRTIYDRTNVGTGLVATFPVTGMEVAQRGVFTLYVLNGGAAGTLNGWCVVRDGASTCQSTPVVLTANSTTSSSIDLGEVDVSGAVLEISVDIATTPANVLQLNVSRKAAETGSSYVYWNGHAWATSSDGSIDDIAARRWMATQRQVSWAVTPNAPNGSVFGHVSATTPETRVRYTITPAP